MCLRQQYLLFCEDRSWCWGDVTSLFFIALKLKPTLTLKSKHPFFLQGNFGAVKRNSN